MYTLHTHCRACGFAKDTNPTGIKANPVTDRLQFGFSLGLQPLANDFCDEKQERRGFAPLDVMVCPQCGLGQLSVVVNPNLLYSHYPYVTSDSETMREHFQTIIHELKQECAFSSILEIGSNDGLFLEHCLKHGASRVVGIDPARNLLQASAARGVMSVCANFEQMMSPEHVVGDVDLIVARHVLCHVDDWTAFFRNLGRVARESTVVAIEVPYVRNMLAASEFDTVYHEHLSYASLQAIRCAAKANNLDLHKVVHYPIHGGSILVLLRVEGSAKPHSDCIQEVESERITMQDWGEFQAASLRKINNLRSFLRKGMKVCGYGASAKSTVWINAVGATRNEISFVTDTTPQKQWKQVPGTNIPVVDPGALLRERPEYAILFAWNYADEIIRKENRWREKGGKFINPHATSDRDFII